MLFLSQVCPSLWRSPEGTLAALAVQVPVLQVKLLQQAHFTLVLGQLAAVVSLPDLGEKKHVT